MRSKDIANQADVSVRTLRHYHRIGLLPEPSRDANSYRKYEIRHLVRLLRIRRLTALGLRLGDLPQLLDGADERRDAVLHELDRTLAARIERLQEQRRTVAALREGEGPIDLSPDLARAIPLLEAARSDGPYGTGRDQLILLESRLTNDGRRALAEVYQRLATPPLAQSVEDLGKRFDALEAGGGEREVTDLAFAYVRDLGPWLHDLDSILENHAEAGSDAILRTHAMETATAAQRQVIERIGSMLASRGEVHGS